MCRAVTVWVFCYMGVSYIAFCLIIITQLFTVSVLCNLFCRYCPEFGDSNVQTSSGASVFFLN